MPVRKRFGQHFLHDANVIRRIIAAIDPTPTDHVVEIGPGEGALTGELVRRAGRVDAIEIDRDLAAVLAVRLPDPRLTVHQADALRFDYATLADGPASLRLVGNLPYNISTPLLFHLLGYAGLFRDMHVMLQREVVERMAAAPGSRQYGRLTVTLAARCRVTSLLRVGPGAFRPPPKVESAVVRLVPRPPDELMIRSLPGFDALVTKAFGTRRKQLGNALRGVLTPVAMQAAGVDPKSRAEQLDLEAFLALARQLP
jgi:16S rRNA (adenine1518-N6/adenine1519-N6)-dimethyltransferase